VPSFTDPSRTRAIANIFLLSVMGCWTVIIVESYGRRNRRFFESPVIAGIDGRGARNGSVTVNRCYPQVWKRLWTTSSISSIYDHKFSIEEVIRKAPSGSRFHTLVKNLDNPGICHKVIHNRWRVSREWFFTASPSLNGLVILCYSGLDTARPSAAAPSWGCYIGWGQGMLGRTNQERRAS
jgi:hypothetical protein